jgi:hypothetical protein
LFQVITHGLIEAFTHFLSGLTGALRDLFVYGEGDIHG